MLNNKIEPRRLSLLNSNSQITCGSNVTIHSKTEQVDIPEFVKYELYKKHYWASFPPVNVPSPLEFGIVLAWMILFIAIGISSLASAFPQ